VDEIVIWRKDPMAVIKALEKAYMLKSLDIPEYNLGRNVEFLGESLNNQELRLDISKTPTFKMSFLNLKVFLAKSSSPSRNS
jgi:hypothetical protein